MDPQSNPSDTFPTLAGRRSWSSRLDVGHAAARALLAVPLAITVACWRYDRTWCTTSSKGAGIERLGPCCYGTADLAATDWARTQTRRDFCALAHHSSCSGSADGSAAS